MRRHSIEPTVFVVSGDGQGHVNVMAAGWNVKCSYNPPMMAVALKVGNFTEQLIQKTKQFVIAVPSPSLQNQLEYVGSVSGADVNKLEHTNLSLQPAEKVEVPLLSDARVNFECTLEQAVLTGDHYLCIGHVVAAHYNADKDQLYFAGRTPDGKRHFQTLHTTFADDN